MKKKKIEALILILLLVVFFGCKNNKKDNSINYNKKANSSWRWDFKDKYLFIISIDSISMSYISGNYCYTFNKNKTDCRTHFRGKSSEDGNIYSVKFKSNYCNDVGKSYIYIFKDSIVWETIQQPCSQIILPKRCQLEQ